ncbi:MAG: L,D-transpeptidase family protein [Proteobacteria bacterium]|nr:L,D-transpeptidase family protein [Pseudomonadota bacterium]
MTRIRNRLKDLRLALAFALMAPLGFAQAQGFSSVSSGTPGAPVAAPSAAGTDLASAPAAAVVPPAADARSGSSPIEAPVTAGAVPTLASAMPPPPAFGGALATGVPAQPSNAGSVSPAVPTPAAPAPAPVAPGVAVTSAFSSSSGSFGSVSGSAPSLPAPPPTQANYGAGSSASFEMAEKVVVIKHERVLRLLRRGRVIAEYPIKLGLNPYGHKQREGDFRTPEGNYELVLRNPKSEFFLSIKISYPNREDAAVASENGHAPGGLIMIHGQPNEPKRPLEYYATRDWTDGCIALSNADMVDVWLRTTAGIPIEIRK